MTPKSNKFCKILATGWTWKNKLGLPINQITNNKILSKWSIAQSTYKLCFWQSTFTPKSHCKPWMGTGLVQNFYRIGKGSTLIINSADCLWVLLICSIINPSQKNKSVAKLWIGSPKWSKNNAKLESERTTTMCKVMTSWQNKKNFSEWIKTLTSWAGTDLA